MLRAVVAGVMVVSMLVIAPASVSAQDQDVALSNLLPNLYSRAVISEYIVFVDELPKFGVPVDEDALFETVRNRFFTDTVPIISLAGNQLSSFPLASPSGGFTWTLDPASGAVTRASTSQGIIRARD